MSNHEKEGYRANDNPQTQSPSLTEAIMSQNGPAENNISADMQEEYELFLAALEDCEETNDLENPGCDDLYLANYARNFETEGRGEGRETVYTPEGIALLARVTIEQAHCITFQVAFLLEYPEMVSPEQRAEVLQNVHDLNDRAGNYIREQMRTSYEEEVAA